MYPDIQSSHLPAPQNWSYHHGRQQTQIDMAWHVPFLLGLLTGFVETKFANTRMGLAAHLEGVMNGTFLIALGAVI